LLFDITIANINYKYNADNPVVKTGLMFGILASDTDYLQIHNKIFEIRVADYFVMKNALQWRENTIRGPINEIVKDNIFNMELCLNKFKQDYAKIYTDKDEKFLEHDGKLIFLIYIVQLINGAGFYHFEPQTRDNGKMDLVIDYLKQQFILEIKLWYGKSRHEDDYEQLSSYLKSKNTDCGYLLTFDFRKKGDKCNSESKWIEWNGKRIFDVIVRVGNGD
jgi:hypothetical protein